MGQRSVLAVDLDGTLIKNDLMDEAFCKMHRKNGFHFIAAFFEILFGGLPRYKYHLAKKTELQARDLPYNPEVLKFIRENQQNYQEIVLITGSPEPWANEVASELKLFQKVYATDKQTNLTGKKKLKLLKEKYPDAEIEYIGNALTDLQVWKGGIKAWVVRPSPLLVKRLKQLALKHEVLSEKPPVLKNLLKELRLSHWAKNLILFIPIIASHGFFNLEYLFNTTLALLSFSFAASAVYILNDLFDVDTDRKKSSKKSRPIAAGELSARTGIFAMVVLLLASFLIAAIVSSSFLYVLALYILMTTLYSMLIKKLVVLDTVWLACLYTTRIIAGAAAIGVIVSNWLLGFSFFLFFGLSCLKRFIELTESIRQNTATLDGRGYIVGDQTVLLATGIASGFVSNLIFALYINSSQQVRLYRHPDFLWFIVFVLVYWTCRLWIKATRHELVGDPIGYALTDRASYISIFIILLFIGLAI